MIGDYGAIPWHIPGEQRRFKAMTMGKPMVMGRKTFQSFPSPLPGRRHIVLTRDPDWSAAGAEVTHTPVEAISLAGNVSEIAVIGGAEIFALFEADRIELTEVHRDANGDTSMPPFDPRVWIENSREDHDGFSYVTLLRR